MRYLISTEMIRHVRRGYEEVGEKKKHETTSRNEKTTTTRKITGHESLNALELLSDKELAIATIGHDRWKT